MANNLNVSILNMSDYLFYLIIAVSLFFIEIVYFRVATHLGIIDRPNHRSSHTNLTIRGGGVIFPIAILLYSLFRSFDYPLFLSGLLLISVISFYDDLRPLSRIIRLLVHLTAVSLLFFEAGITNYQFWILALVGIIVIGTINAYNFMDGINGITGLYSLSILLSILWLNGSENFIDSGWLITVIISLLVFLFFNFRQRARCFAGDTGSVSIAFIILFFLALLIIHTGQLSYVLFLAIYGVDSVLTIIFRLINGENIFEAHRSHAYQYLSNELGMGHLLVSAIYAGLQFLINILIIYMVGNGFGWAFEILTSLSVLGLLSLFYLWIRAIKLKKQSLQAS